MLSDKTLRLVPDESIADCGYLELALKSPGVRRQIDGLLSGTSGQKNISQKFIKSLSVSLPELWRQKKVADIASALDRQIEASRMVQRKLLLERRGLAEDLVTGRVRI
jgi:type I restriction enzyme S subunit